MANGYSIHVAAHKSQKIGASKAPGAELAAVAMHEIAVGLGYTESVLLVDTQATTQKFKDELQRLAGKLHAGDILFVSLAGTGKALAESTDCPHAHDQGVNLFDDLLVDDEIYCRLSKITVNARVIVVADVCDGSKLLRLFLKVKRFLFNKPNVADPSRMFDCRQELPADVLLLAPTGFTPAGKDESEVPLFSRAIQENWKKSTSYDDLRDNINGEASSLETIMHAGLNTRLSHNNGFEGQPPFSI